MLRDGVEMLTGEVNRGHAAEFRVCPYDGGFVAMHGSMFDRFVAVANSFIYETATVGGRGVATLEHVTPGTTFLQYPVCPVLSGNGSSAVFRQGEPFMKNVVVLAGGQHVDKTAGSSAASSVASSSSSSSSATTSAATDGVRREEGGLDDAALIGL